MTIDKIKVEHFWNLADDDEKVYILQRAASASDDLFIKRANIYVENQNIWELYSEIQNDEKAKQTIQNLCGIPINLNIDLHTDSENYDNFIEYASEIIVHLSINHKKWMIELLSAKRDFENEEILMIIDSFLKSFDIWKD